MTTPDAAFFALALPYARQASAATGVHTSVVLAQWAIETGYGGPDWYLYHNPGNVGDPAKAGQLTYPSIEAGVEGYIETMMLGYYTSVRGAFSVTAQCYALGLSPWAAGHYMAAGVAGELLINVIDLFDLTQYDAAAAGGTTIPGAPPAAPIEKEEPVLAISADGKTIVATRTDGHLLVAAVGPSGTFNDASLVDLTDRGQTVNGAGGPWTFSQ